MEIPNLGDKHVFVYLSTKKLHLMKNWNKTSSTYKLTLGLSILFGLLLFTSCGDDETIECGEEINFSQNSTMMSFTLDEQGDNGARARFSLNQPNFNNGNSLSRTLTLIGRSGDDSILLSLEINVDDEFSCIPEGVYRANTSDTKDGLVNINFLNGAGAFIHGLDQSDANIEITNCNLAEGTVSGNFSGVLFLSMNTTFPNQFISITGGSFDSICMFVE